MKPIQYIVLIILAMNLLACKAMKALDATLEMNKKMDEMNKKMATMDEMNKKMGTMEKMDTKMGSMVDAVAMQKLGLAVDHAMKESHISVAQSLAGAKIFGETANTDQITGFFKAWFSTIDTLAKKIAPLQDAIKVLVEKESKGPLSEPEKLELRGLRTKLAPDEEKYRSWYYGLGAIAYMLPQEKIVEIVNSQISNPGTYENIAYGILALRGQFIELVVFAGAVMSSVMNSDDRNKQITNLAQLQDAVNGFINFNYLMNLDFKDQIYHRIPGYPFGPIPAKDRDFAESLKLLKEVIEKQIDCKHLKDNRGQAIFNWVLEKLNPMFEKLQIAPPAKSC